MNQTITINIGFYECWNCGEIYNLNERKTCPCCKEEPEEDSDFPLILDIKD